MKKIISIVIVLAAIIFAVLSSRNHGFTNFSGYAIGTKYSIRIADKVDATQVETGILSEIEDITAKMSHFKKDSELSRFNNAPINEWFDVSDRLFKVLLEAQKVYELSDGFFDVTVGDLVDLWGFGAKHKDKISIPTAEEIKAAKSKTGFNLIEFDYENQKIIKKAETEINLSAIAKGYLVDVIFEHLEMSGLNNFMVEIGGEVRVKGFRNVSNKEKWRIGIEKPSAGERVVMKILSIADIAVATSGDYRSFFEHEGKRYSHTIDPKTGFPVNHNVVSASVFNNSCMVADAYATAILAMGKDKALKWIDEYKIPAILYFAEDYGGFKEYISQEALNEL